MAATTSPRAAAPLPLTRGRRAALIIGVPVCLALIANAGFSLVAPFAQGRYTVGYAAPAGTRSLTVIASGGQLAIRPAAGDRATIAGTARYSFIRSTLTERTAGGDTTLDYHCVPLPSGTCDLDATVGVPATLPVTTAVGGGNVTVSGMDAPVALSAGGGNLSADHVAGPLRLTTGGGNIRVTGATSETVTASSGGGNIDIVFAAVPRDVTVRTSGGNITVFVPRAAAGYHVTAHTDGGNVSDSLRENDGSPSTITATSGGGNITLRER